MSSLPVIIQGGMGAGVSNWRLANVVAQTGQLGVVSGTALDAFLVRRLQMGDLGGEMRRALDHFPNQDVARRILADYYIPGGKGANTPFCAMMMYSLHPPQKLTELTIAANFVEVFLAKEGHSGPVGINYLEKIQLPNTASIYGAMLAEVDYILMGAGIPREIPGIIEHLARHEEAAMTIFVDGAAAGETHEIRIRPQEIMGPGLPELKRPMFLPIVASASLASILARKSSGKIDGFVVEGYTAGGHNAPPRGKAEFNSRGEPVYGERDEPDYQKIRELGLPFWIAGQCGTPEKVQEALSLGAAGVQVGTPFAFCVESGIDPEIREQVLKKVAENTADVFTDPLASPTGFPFKVIVLEGTYSDRETYESRPRVCDLGFLRQPYKTETGEVGYRCAAEPVDSYLRKGGKIENTVGRKCLCNGLVTNVGLPQLRKDTIERPLLTAGEFLRDLSRHLPNGSLVYSARDVVQYLLGQLTPPQSLEDATALPSHC